MPIDEVESTAADIEEMEIRGAATIASEAADALGAQAAESDASDPEAFRAELRKAARTLYETRPTAVSLPNALRFVLQDMQGETVANPAMSSGKTSKTPRSDWAGSGPTATGTVMLS
jgi:ribose 1,5-bisphosphate isomerase